jgi:Polyketide cyclase / dehydrase and lipid transport.
MEDKNPTSPSENSPQKDSNQRTMDGGVYSSQSIKVTADPSAIYSFCLNPANIGVLLTELLTVVKTSDRTYSFVWKKNRNENGVNWKLEFTEKEPAKFMAWKAVSESNVQFSGRLEFIPQGDHRGTIVRCRLQFASVDESRHPEDILTRALVNLRDLMEGHTTFH